MTDEQFAKIALTMKEIYPKENLFPTDHSQETWYQLLKDLPYDVVSMALAKWSVTEKWSPSIAEIRGMAYDVTNPEIKTWDEAWQEVLLAIRTYGNSRRIEAMDTFDEITRKVVSRVGWMQLCMSEEISIERAAFRDIYKALADKTKTEGQMSSAVKAVIEATRKARVEDFEKRKRLESGKDASVKGETEKPQMSSRVQDLINQTKERLKKEA